MSSFNVDNELDQIRAVLRKYSLDRWGFVIYRCTYGDNTAWNTFTSILKYRAHDSLKMLNALDLEQSLHWTFIENKDSLDGASIENVKAQFRNWVATEGQREQAGRKSLEDPEQLANTDRNLWMTTDGRFPTRYRFCVHVDDGALDSVVSHAPRPPLDDLEGIGYVNVVNCRLPLPVPQIVSGSYHKEENDEDWMRMSAMFLIPGNYSHLQQIDTWNNLWVQPPEGCAD